MAFLRSYTGGDASHRLEGRGLLLKPPQSNDYAPWAELRALSRDHLIPWEPQWSSDELSRTAFRRRLRHYHREAAEDHGYAFLIFAADAGTLLGGVTLTGVRRGVTQSASLGYWIGRPYARRGLMTEAVRTVLPFAFDVLRLHRVEAATQPTNVPSMRVLERNGFVREGFARSYLKINGQWADHMLFGRLSGDPCDAGHIAAADALGAQRA